MKRVIHRPAAAAIVDSLRSIGYSFNTAIADVIDNCLSAGARNVFIRLDTIDSRPVVTIRDDGHGMNKADLIEAMRHGAAREIARNPTDLGRFGLGLKTASLSQCRKLTVASLGSERLLSLARWDLNEVERKNDWILLLPTKADVADRRAVNGLLKQGRGTLVIWEDFDLALSGSDAEVSALEGLLDEARSHLAMVFQRFMHGGDARPEIHLFINELEIQSVDPFLSLNNKTQQLPTEEIRIRSSRIRITAFILPQLKNIPPRDLELLGGPSGIRQGQGFYVYRNKRLIIAGTWFRMLRLDELTKLARVRIDIPNNLDDLWSLDVKKSTANPPEQVRRVLKRIIERIATQSLATFGAQRSRSGPTTITPVWLRKSTHNVLSYVINRDHPIIAQMLDDGSHEKSAITERVLRLLESSLPYVSLLADVSQQGSMEPSESDSKALLQELLEDWMVRCGDDSNMKRQILTALPLLEPFSKHTTLTRSLIEAYLHAIK